MQKYWIKCSIPKGDDMVLTTRAENERHAASKIKSNYNIKEVLEVKSVPYIDYDQHKEILIGMSFTSENHFMKTNYK